MTIVPALNTILSVRSINALLFLYYIFYQKYHVMIYLKLYLYFYIMLVVQYHIYQSIVSKSSCLLFSKPVHITLIFYKDYIQEKVKASENTLQ